ncbi:large conductance mechanosensitive channel protein MscL [Geminicoccaceae bacterium 1502E]|nr:large conductance mechanosensitive channel protein MscL [Geminicoccaceae bacterium 1502E]
MLKEFREFALKGNVADMAVGIIIGAAFTTVVRSLVDDIMMPPLGALFGGLDFSDYFIQLTMRDRDFTSLAEAREAGAAVIAYGSFANAVVQFLIVAAALFVLVRQMNRLRRMMEREQAAKPEPAIEKLSREVELLTDIRELLARPGRPSQTQPPSAT